MDRSASEVGRLITLPETEGHATSERRPWRTSDLAIHLAEEGWGWLQDDDESDGCLMKGGWSMPHPSDTEPDRPPW